MLRLSFITTICLALAGPAMANEMENQALALINQHRTSAGCEPLTPNAKLAAAAKGHAQAMAQKNFFSHKSKNGATFSSRIKAAGYRAGWMAENIAGGQSTAAAVVSEWMGSAGHAKNIRNCALKESGIAVVYQKDDEPLPGQKYPMRYYWVQVFAAP
jgi:uncharacterized protein YkwD